ncbi:hypothetical protein PIB30_028194 [Stylosanthes scabra]|uniref:Uncharacterized protein n=1 Tax=Stylosanthes scabra TaxID=79078 RepID=A0ABU6RBJ0_9FABA|nr:hypothetical protein [Stylosanthes scabra]
MAGLLRKRKGKEVASSSEGARFKTPYHEAHYNSKLSARKILPELLIQVDERIHDPCAFQIEKRKWERFTNPIQAVGQIMVREFYANAWEPEKEKRKPYTYTTMVRGKEISFAPNNIPDFFGTTCTGLTHSLSEMGIHSSLGPPYRFHIFLHVDSMGTNSGVNPLEIF